MKLSPTASRGFAAAVAAGALASVALLLSPAGAGAAPLKKITELKNVLITEYYPVPEVWFVGRKVRAPGLNSEHRVDWHGGRHCGGRCGPCCLPGRLVWTILKCRSCAERFTGRRRKLRDVPPGLPQRAEPFAD